MAKSRSRETVLNYLTRNGPVGDPDGRATALLMEAVNYAGSTAGFAQLIAAMDRSGKLIRDVTGKRTYRIAAAVADPSHTGVEDPSVTPIMDYDELAAALLVKVTNIVAAGSVARQEPAWSVRRIEKLETRNGELERELARAKAKQTEIEGERDQLRQQLENSEGNLAALSERLKTGKAYDKSTEHRLSDAERALLEHLRQPRPIIGGRVDMDAGKNGRA